MQLRCPENNCPIEVPDDLVGTRIRCPHCAAMLTVEAPVSEGNESVNLEHQIYDGMPPLSVMMALRRQQGAAFDADDFATRYPMTDDDWKALSAFESVLYSVVSLRTTVMVAALALLVNILGCSLLMSESARDGGRTAIQLMSLFAAS